MARGVLLLLFLAAAAIARPPMGGSLVLPPDTLPAELPLGAIPRGLARERQIPKDNPLTSEKVRLGRRLFFDPILSADRTVSCASCHQPAHGFASPEPVAVGVRGKRTLRNPPSLLNRAFGTAFFWDGREHTLEAQALRPIENPREMGSSVAQAVVRLRAHGEYPALFQAAFRAKITAENLGKALASFERVLLSGDSRVDRFRAGETQALDDRERHGLWLYESRGRCWRCHSGPNFSDEGFHNTGVSWGATPADLGRFDVTAKAEDRGRFKTPTLRGLKQTAPYMHDGSRTTLEEVVNFYNRGGGKNPNLDPALEPLGLSQADLQDLVAFLRALSDQPADASKRK